MHCIFKFEFEMLNIHLSPENPFPTEESSKNCKFVVQILLAVYLNHINIC